MSINYPLSIVAEELSNPRNMSEGSVAKAIVDRLLELGWAPPAFVATMVVNAGGTVKIEDSALLDDFELQVYRERDLMRTTIQARRKD